MDTNFLKGTKILIVEDNALNYFVLKSVLEKLEATHFWAKNGKEAIDIFSQQKDITLILMDISMPEMDGITATKHIREIDKHVPIIFQTAFASEENEIECKKAGGDEFLTKPIKTKQLIHVLRKYTSHSINKK
jgi:two-component system, cell cycle response regulator DivK